MFWGKKSKFLEPTQFIQEVANHRLHLRECGHLPGVEREFQCKFGLGTRLAKPEKFYDNDQQLPGREPHAVQNCANPVMWWLYLL